MRPAITSVEHGPVHPSQSDVYESSLEEAAPAPVFVDQSGLRGRLLRGLGWPVSLVGAILAVGMASSMVGMQADAPAMGIPAHPPVHSPAPSPTPVTSPSPTPSHSRSPSHSASPSHSPSSPRTPSRSATPSTKTTPKSTTTPRRGATPSGQSTKQP
ncbi:hypothetical protein [Kitasatospora sp. NE20-6]|uniref:hypothetical protein n=1 Tax=Kitasatospora sp. NE20-6 TaxID=2859066 RepID=UPI0038B35128